MDSMENSKDNSLELASNGKAKAKETKVLVSIT